MNLGRLLGLEIEPLVAVPHCSSATIPSFYIAIMSCSMGSSSHPRAPRHSVSQAAGVDADRRRPRRWHEDSFAHDRFCERWHAVAASLLERRAVCARDADLRVLRTALLLFDTAALAAPSRTWCERHPSTIVIFRLPPGEKEGLASWGVHDRRFLKVLFLIGSDPDRTLADSFLNLTQPPAANKSLSPTCQCGPSRVTAQSESA